MGWIGTKCQVLHFLGTVNADRDENGNFLLVGPEGGGPSLFLGVDTDDNDVVIPNKCDYLVDGQRRNLAAGLGGTSSGCSVTVI